MGANQLLLQCGLRASANILQLAQFVISSYPDKCVPLY